MDPLVLAGVFQGDFISLLFYAALIFFALYSFIIAYHWLRWCIGYNMKIWSLSVYFAGSFILLVALFGAYLSI